jgi:hypothetical protein
MIYFIFITLLACFQTAIAYPPMAHPTPQLHNCTDTANPSRYNISTPMRLNKTWLSHNTTHPMHSAGCTCAHCINSTSATSNFTAQMSYGRTDPVHTVHVDPLVALGIAGAILVVFVLGMWGIVWLKRRFAKGKAQATAV